MFLQNCSYKKSVVAQLGQRIPTLSRILKTISRKLVFLDRKYNQVIKEKVKKHLLKTNCENSNIICFVTTFFAKLKKISRVITRRFEGLQKWSIVVKWVNLANIYVSMVTWYTNTHQTHPENNEQLLLMYLHVT